MKTLLVLADFSKISDSACLYAFHFAKDLKANIALAHIVTPQLLESQKEISYVEKFSKDKLIALADQMKEKSDAKDINVNYFVKKGSFINSIKEIIKESKCDYIVIGTQGVYILLQFNQSGHGYLYTKVFGSHTTEVLAKITNIPVLVIPPNFKYIKPTTIVYASEFSKDQVLKKPVLGLIELAEVFDSEIIFVHVDTTLFQKTLSRVFMLDADVMYLDPELSTEEAKKLKDELEQKMEDNYSRFCNYEKKRFCVLSEDKILDALKKFVEKEQAQMLTMVKRKKGFFESFLRGSSTKDMAVNCNVPLLVFHEQ